jgi:phosphatidylglycerophosphate synthase
MFALRSRETAYQRWLLMQAIVGVMLLCSLSLSSSLEIAFGVVAAWIVLAFGSLLVVVGGIRTPADAVTVLRVGLLVGWILTSSGSLVSAISLLVILGLDLVDGWLARRFGGSDEGAVYDMEADQLAVVAMACAAFAYGLPAWVLLLPGLKYANILLTAALRLPAGDPKPKDGDNRRGRLICAFVFAALWLALVPLVPMPLKTTLSAVAVGLLSFSFGDDLRFLLLHRLPGNRAVR